MYKFMHNSKEWMSMIHLDLEIVGLISIGLVIRSASDCVSLGTIPLGAVQDSTWMNQGMKGMKE